MSSEVSYRAAETAADLRSSMAAAPRGWLAWLDGTGVPLLIARLVLGYLFITMGWHKAMDPENFLKLIREYKMLPESSYLLLNLIGVILPWLEIFCGGLLIAGVALRGTSLLLMIMLAGFTVIVAMRAMGIAETQGIPLCNVKFDCGCGGGEVYACHKVPENIGLLLLSLLILLSRSRRFCLYGDLFRRS